MSRVVSAELKEALESPTYFLVQGVDLDRSLIVRTVTEQVGFQ